MSETLDKLIEEIKVLKEARSLLEEVYLELGPYAANTKDLSVKRETWNKVRRFFKFDDSE